MEKQTFSGKTLDEALSAAAQAFGVDKHSVQYTVLEQSSGGGLLSKLFSRAQVRVEAWAQEGHDLKQAAREMVRQAISKEAPQAKQKQAIERPQGGPRPPQQGKRNEAQRDKRRAGPQEAQAVRPKEHRRERSPQREPRPNANIEGGEAREPRASETFASPQVRALFEEYVGEFLKCFEVEKEQATITFDDQGRASVSVNDPFLEEFLSKTDRLSSAFEHVFKRIVQKKIGDVADRITLESGRSVELREERLKEMAISIAEKVKKTGRAVTLAAKSAPERRTIHLTIDEIDGVATKSVGTGEQRKLIIFSTSPEHKRAPRGPRPQEGAQAAPRADGGQAVPGKRRRRRGRGGRGRNRGVEAGGNNANQGGARDESSDAPSNEALT